MKKVRNHIHVIFPNESAETVVKGTVEVEKKVKAEVTTPTPAPVEAKEVIKENVVAQVPVADKK